MSTFDTLATGSCVTVASFEMDNVTNSWTFCISVLEGEGGRDSEFGWIWGFKIMCGTSRVRVSVATVADVRLRLLGKEAGKVGAFRL